MQRQLKITNSRGLHARAAARFAECASGFDAAILVRKDGLEVDGTSIMDLLMLGASMGCSIEVETEGGEAEDALTALSELVEGRFGEAD